MSFDFRPFGEEELRPNAPQVVTSNGYKDVTQNIAGKQIFRIFTFDKVYSSFYRTCVLQSELEQSIKGNAALFSKIGSLTSLELSTNLFVIEQWSDREAMLSAKNRATVNTFRGELGQKVDSLCIR